MNTYYTQTGATVLIQDDKNNVRTEDNLSNIEAILLLENDKERVKNRIESLKEDQKELKDATKKAYLHNHRTFLSGVIGVVAASVIGRTLIHGINPNVYVNMSIPNSPFGIFASIVLLLTKEESYHKFKVEKEKIDKKKKETNTRIKNLDILKFSVDRELKLERNANLTTYTKTPPKKIYNKGLVDFDILDYYEKNHDEIIDYYKKTKSVKYFNNEFNTRLVSTMVQKELYDAENNVTLKDRLKSKVRNKVNNILR